MNRLLVILAILLACAPRVAVGQDAPAHVHGGELEADEYSPDSLFLTESEWTTSSGKTVHLRDFRGKPHLIALFYASCTSACPAIVEAMKRVERSLPAESKEKLEYLLVTFDPKEDTAAVLEAYAKKRVLGKSWTLLRGSEDDVRELAVLLGGKFKQLGPKNFAHTNLIALLDGEGRIVSRVKALSELERLVSAVHEFLGVK